MPAQFKSVLLPLLAVVSVMLACSSSDTAETSTSGGAQASELATTEAPPADTSTPEHERSLGYKLATIDGDGFVSDDDPSIRRFDSLLESLAEQYPEGEQEIADMSVRAYQILRDKGITESVQNIMEEMNRIGPSNLARSKYAEVVASYLVLREKSQTHDESISGISALLRALGS